MRKLQVIATLNSHLLKGEALEKLVAGGATILRINGSHVFPSELGAYASEIRKALGNRAKILVDLPGNKVRTGVLSQPIVLERGKHFEIRSDQINYPQFLSLLQKGDEIYANDSLFRFTVESSSAAKAVFLSHSEGLLTSNKGMHLMGRHPELPFLFPRDRELIAEAIRHKIDYLGLSFVRTAEDVRSVRESIKDSGVGTIVKVETSQAIENLDAILATSEDFLVDRGDLSCDVGIENINYFQKLILQRVKNSGKRIFFATQFLHSMVHNNVPLIAEVCGLADAFEIGVDGIQLSEETAMGKHPFEVLGIVQKIFAATMAQKNTAPAKIEKTSPVLWLTGRSGAGKTTIAKKLIALYESQGIRAGLVDGDDFRAFWGNDTGYTREDRFRNLRNIIFTAHQASRAFDVVVVSSLSPYAEIRALAREKLPNFREIYIDCSQEVCRARDPKGNYAKASKGEIQNFIGASEEEYEVPKKPDLTVNTETLSVDEAVRAIDAFHRRK